MEVNKIISHALQSMPPSKRQKAFAKDTSKLIHMGLNENNYGMSPTPWREAIFILTLRQYC